MDKRIISILVAFISVHVHIYVDVNALVCIDIFLYSDLMNWTDSSESNLAQGAHTNNTIN